MDVAMLCTRRTKTLVSTCVILSGMTNIVCLVYVGWISNHVSNRPKVQQTVGEAARKLEEDSKGETHRMMERLDRLEDVINEHIQDKAAKESEDAPSSSSSRHSDSLFDHWGRDLGPESRRVARKKFRYYGYNSFLSDRISITRPIPDFRPDGCKTMWYSSDLPQLSIIFIFVNEALSVLLRSVNTAIQRTPSHLLKEIILVDDHSNNLELKEHLQSFVDEMNAQRGPEFIKIVHHEKQEGLIRSRVSGWRIASAPVVALFDANVEFNTGWAEPVLQRIKEDSTRVVSPSFDNIKYDTFEIEEYPLSAQGFDWELWCRYLNPPKSWWTQRNHTAPIRSPALTACFVVDREFFEGIGLLDEGMEIYGGENVELGIRVWQCGGSVEVLPCSRVARMERAHKPYTVNLTAVVRRNALRVAEVWMDEYKSHVYMAWNVPLQNLEINIGDILERKALRSRLKCHPFSWFLANIYPELRTYSDIVAYGVLKNSLRDDLCLDQGPSSDNIPIMHVCHGSTAQNAYYSSSQQLHLGGLSPTIDDADNKCLVEVNSKPRLLECTYAASKHMKLSWTFMQDGSIQNKESQHCLEMVESDQPELGFQLVIQDCSGQKWTITNALSVLPL
ncbi:polypeptide N-acetylgalactosaminyltransferase 18-like isoform X1 [Nerophis lumbriciformis]|uniref:polypeptide N-acetylgalactosaminyltransferase 18-like isoform X1 n=1 Tax=Nerophis lumbriciformis TaxID=546530 RepID=UPI002ADFC5E8|nr:polypeptide N-acetylgalactosaminyltransferase 18-like isoform X1 [Nerophis lumbriciformis]